MSCNCHCSNPIQITDEITEKINEETKPFLSDLLIRLIEHKVFLDKLPSYLF